MGFSRLAAGLVLLLLCASSAQAANKFVRAGAAGTGSGNDWTNAYATLEAAEPLVRGNTYYLADGDLNNGGFDLDVAASGTTRIILKKCTAADHGTETGYQSTYCDGVTEIPQLFVNSQSAGYYTIDGAYEWGFKCNYANAETCFQFVRGAPGYTVQYVEMEGPDTSDYPTGSDCARGIDITAWNGVNAFDAVLNFVASHVKIHKSDTLIQFAKANGAIIEHSELFDSHGDNECHGNILFTQETDDAIFRYNLVYNIQAEGILFTFGGFFDNQSGWEIYGNVFRDGYQGSDAARGIETHQDAQLEDGEWGPIYIYNNTFANLALHALYLRGGGHSTTEVYNNIFYQTGSSGGLVWTESSVEPLHNYNWSTGTLNGSEANGISGGSDPFVDLAGDDLHLDGALAGTSSGSLAGNATDGDGCTRGDDGTWDRGAFEFNAEDCESEPEPSSSGTRPPFLIRPGDDEEGDE